MLKLKRLFGFLVLIICVTNISRAQESGPSGWRKVNAKGYFTFYLPNNIILKNRDRCEKCSWSSTLANDRIELYAEYPSWTEGFHDYVAKQPEYTKELTEIGGREAMIRSWYSGRCQCYMVEARFYATAGKIMARMSARCKERSDIDTVRQIYRTVIFSKSRRV